MYISFTSRVLGAGREEEEGTDCCGWNDCDWVTRGEEAGAMAAEGKTEEFGRRKEGLLWGMGC